ncbi:helix-turn-helix domain-containing protein [Frigoribacterium sp. ACAM 257]|uniref:helix-turn-helix domain-containing protein n=1 Tax=Frigoribacterium sp. ACAM 257 TaxID=2508998 RepID=UPI00351B32D1
MRDHLGLTPTKFLRNVRLDRVRNELAVKCVPGTLVSDVATRWGFNNLGRFSAVYNERFAEYPRETLERPATCHPAVGTRAFSTRGER